MEVIHLILNVQRRLYRAGDVIGLFQRGIIERHHAVPQELVDRAAIALNDFDDQRIIGGQNVEQILRRSLLAQARKSFQVGEKDRYILQLAPQLYLRWILQELLDHWRRDIAGKQTADDRLRLAQLIGLVFGAQPGVHAGHEFTRAVGLDQVVIRAHAQTLYAILDLGAGRHHDNRNV